MTAFPQSLRDLALEKERTATALYEAHKALTETSCDAPERASRIIEREIALNASAKAACAFDAALSAYMASQRGGA